MVIVELAVLHVYGRGKVGVVECQQHVKCMNGVIDNRVSRRCVAQMASYIPRIACISGMH